MALDHEKQARHYLGLTMGRTGEKSRERLVSLLQILERFKPESLRITLNCFIESAKLVGVRQERLKKHQLRPKDLRSAIDLISYHYARTSLQDASKSDLGKFMGKDITEDQALRYFEKSVIGAEKDRWGREIVIDEDGMRHMYKDSQGKHVIEAKNFKPIRAKRLPWIRWTLANSRELYQTKSGGWLEYAYIQTFGVPSRTKSITNYFMVIARKENKQAPIKLVTAFYFETHEDFLKHIERFEPFPHAPTGDA